MFEQLTLAQRSELWFALPLVGALPLVLSLFGMPWDEGVLVFGICAVPLAYLALALAAIVRKVAEPTRSELIALFLCAVVTPALMKAMGGLPLDEGVLYGWCGFSVVAMMQIKLAAALTGARTSERITAAIVLSNRGVALMLALLLPGWLYLGSPYHWTSAEEPPTLAFDEVILLCHALLLPVWCVCRELGGNACVAVLLRVVTDSKHLPTSAQIAPPPASPEPQRRCNGAHTMSAGARAYAGYAPAEPARPRPPRPWSPPAGARNGDARPRYGDWSARSTAPPPRIYSSVGAREVYQVATRQVL